MTVMPHAVRPVWHRFAIAAGAALLAGLAVPAPSLTAQGYDEREDAVGRSGEVDPDEFQQQLSRYGSWFEHPRWGYVWSPEVDLDWRPYTRGYWANTEEYGWLWVSDEPFGWAVYHYGRWTYEEGDGWIWIPGRTWAPAWVSWRHSDEYVGWAPLPPEAEWIPERGLSAYSPSYYDGGRASLFWVFVRPHRMFEPGLYRHVEPASRAPLIVRQTRFVHGFAPGEGRLYNRGFDVQRLQQVIGRPVPLARVRPVSTSGEHGLRRGLPPGGGIDVPVYRPRVAPATIRPPSAGRPGVSILQPRAEPGRDPGWRPGADRPRGTGDPQARPGVPTTRPQPSSVPVPNRPSAGVPGGRPLPDGAPVEPPRRQPQVVPRTQPQTQPAVQPRAQPPGTPGAQPGSSQPPAHTQLPPVINQPRQQPAAAPPPQAPPRHPPPVPGGQPPRQSPGQRPPPDPNQPQPPR